MATGGESTLHGARRASYTFAVQPGNSDAPARVTDRRQQKRLGWIVTGLGGVLMLWGVLYFTSHAVGGRVEDFAHRRTYNNTKVAVHEAFPGFLWRAALGLALAMVGARMRKVDAPGVSEHRAGA